MMKAERFFAALLVLILAIAPAPAQETVFVVEYHPDPCREIAEAGKDKTSTVGKVTISHEPFYYAACEQVRTYIVDSIQARADAIRGDMEAEVKSRLAPIYDGFLKWLSLEVYERLPEADKARIKPEEHFREWLEHPDQELTTYVNFYMKKELPTLVKLLERYQNDSSLEIVDGLKALWASARERLENIGKAKRELEAAPPDTDYTDILRKYGLSGEWIDKLQHYEGQFDLLDKNYNIVDTARTIHGAFTAEKYSGRLEGMFTLMEKFGGYLSDSNVPGVSLMGTLIEAYGQMAKEVLARANELEQLIRAREGFCIGMATHTLLNDRSQALMAMEGEGVQACPLDEKAPLLKDIYVQTDPQDETQLYFWLNDAFVKGREKGGGEAGLRRARDFIREAADIGFAEYVGKDSDMKTIIAVYNTPYGPEHYLEGLPGHRSSPGLPGLIAEADAVVEAIVRRVGELKAYLRLDSDCGENEFSRLIESETGLRLSAFPLDDFTTQEKLKTSYALGFIQSHAATGGGTRTESYRRYRQIWERLKDLSLVLIDGQLVDKARSSEPCDKCASGSVSLTVSNGGEMPGCRIAAADEKGRFTARIVTRSPGVSLQAQATVGDVTSDPETVDARHLGLDGVEPPFMRSFSLNLFLPFEAEGDVDETLDALRGLHGKALGEAADGRAACSAARGAVASIEAKSADVKARIAALEKDVQTLRPRVTRMNRDVADSARLVSDAEAAAEKVVKAKQDAEKAALAACEKTSDLRAESDEAKQRRMLTEVRSASTDAALQARNAANARRDTDRAAQTAEDIAERSLPTAEAVSRLPGRLAEVTALIGEIDALRGQVTEGIATLRESADAVAETEASAKSVHAAVMSLAATADDPAAVRAEADRLYEAIKAIVGELTGCLQELETAQTELGEDDPATGMDDLSSAIATLSGQPDAQSPTDLLQTRASTARASADVAEIFAEAAESAAADAKRCLALAESALTEDRTDDKAAAAEAAISQCRFAEARRLLKDMTGHPRYGQIASAYNSAVEREDQTKAAYGRAQTLYKNGDAEGALAALESARANTACDGFRETIDKAISRIRSSSNDSLVAEARGAIAACEFETAKKKLAELAEAGHPSYSEVKADYDAAVEREDRTRALWEQARTTHKQGDKEGALALLQSARDNTQCSDFTARIDQTIAALGAAEPPAGDQPELSAGLAQPWKGEIRMTGMFVNGRAMDPAAVVSLIDRAAKRAKARADSNNESFASGIARAISEAILDIINVGLHLLDEGVPISFALVPEGQGYRVTAIDPSNADVEKNIKRIPLMVPVDEHRLRMNYTGEDGQFTLVASAEYDKDADTMAMKLQVDGRNEPDDGMYSDIQTMRIVLTGTLQPGAIPAPQLEAEIKQRFESVARRYAPDLLKDN